MRRKRAEISRCLKQQPGIRNAQPSSGALDGHAVADAGTAAWVCLGAGAVAWADVKCFCTSIRLWAILSLSTPISSCLHGRSSRWAGSSTSFSVERRPWAASMKSCRAEPEITDAHVAPDLKSVTTVRGEIEFRHLSFNYNGVPVLKDINLTIPAGSSLAIVGPTGSGKTTLVSLLPRIYDAAPGSLLIDGRPSVNIRWKRCARILALFRRKLFFSAIRSAKILLSAWRMPVTSRCAPRRKQPTSPLTLKGFPESYNTLVGERGITLSGGQKQRTAIARAIIRDPRILVLDDALSSVDTYTEERILNHLRASNAGPHYYFYFASRFNRPQC